MLHNVDLNYSILELVIKGWVKNQWKPCERFYSGGALAPVSIERFNHPLPQSREVVREIQG